MTKIPDRYRSDSQIAGTDRSSERDIAKFLKKTSAIQTSLDQSGRLVFALDATMSRQPTWDLACTLQSKMFDSASSVGSLLMQLVYYRGLDECRASRFVADGPALKRLMVKIDCRGGHTQIRKILKHALDENGRQKLSAVVFIGDAVEENVDDLSNIAGQLGIKGVPVFVFQEGHDGGAEMALREIARLSKGAWFRFDSASADTLSRLLSSIAVYAAGGIKALQLRNTDADRLLIGHLNPKRS